jgi:hypothetical protein
MRPPILPPNPPEAWPTEEIRDIMLELREEQERTRARLEAILRRLARITGDLPKPRVPARFESPFRKENKRKATRK